MALLRPCAVALGAILLASCGGGSNASDEPSTTLEEVITTASTSTSTTLSANPCVATVQQLEGSEDLPAEVDLVNLAKSDRLAALPVPGAEAGEITNAVAYSSPEEYVANVTVDYPGTRIAEMRTAGHVISLDLRYRFGRDFYGVIIHEFGSPEQAEVYRNSHLVEACSRADSMRPMPTVTGGASFYRSDTNPQLARGTFVLGPYEVNLDICSCVEVADRQALAEQWAAAIIAEANAA